MVPLAHGGDGGGSIRAPASWNGLFGLKPSRGRVSNAPDEADPWAGMICRHVLTRSVRDSALLLDWLSRCDGGDPYVAPATPRPYAEEVGASPAGLRVGWLDRDPLGGAVDPACAAAVRDTARRLEDAGCIVEESFPAAYAEIDFPAMSSIANTWIAYQIATLIRRTGVVPDDADFMPGTRQALAAGRTMSGADYVAAVERMHAWSRRMKDWWRDFDLLIAPTMPTSAPTFADIEALDLSDPVRRYDTIAFTAPFNMTGQPAASVPGAWRADGLPVGVQLIAGLGREDLIFRAAAHLETAAPWAGRRPRLWAD
jgi:amidase